MAALHDLEVKEADTLLHHALKRLRLFVDLNLESTKDRLRLLFELCMD
jgi:type II secretory pathway predicted ATPase ExeA